jgi:methionine-rich copper-binding protein CopC
VELDAVMRIHATFRFRILLCVAIVFAVRSTAFAHAILVNSTPKANETISGPAVTLALTFNSKVDQARSTLIVEKSDHSSSKVPINVDRSSPEKLTGTVSSLTPGAYKLHWQVLAVDGHITRGQFSFQVK